MKEENSYWEILDNMPIGWKIDSTAGSPIKNTVFITNGKSVLNNQKRALLRIEPIKQEEHKTYQEKINTEKENVLCIKEEIAFPVKTVNELARKKFLEQILKDIMFDLTVCEIEGWDKKEYIREIKRLINSFNLSNKNNVNYMQGSLF